MSEIDRLIAEHCPGGVEFRTVASASRTVAMRGKVKREDYGLGSEFPIVDQSVDFIAGYTDDAEIVAPADEYIVFGDHTRAVKFIDSEFAQGADGVKVLQATAGLSTKWLYYCLSNLDVPSRGYNRHWTVLREMRIPVPPPAVQSRIVEILDAMAELQAELQAELRARTRQYEHYRDHLLTFVGREDIRWEPMGEVGTFFRGRRFTKNDIVAAGVEAIHYGEIYTDYGVATPKTVSHVREDIASQLRFAQPGDVVIAGVGETVEDVGKAVAWLGSGEVAIHDDTFAYRHEMNPKFVSYYLQTAAFHAQKERHVSRAKVKRLSSGGLAQIKIPVPQREEQDRVVAILDGFDALISDLSIGLPAEIEARRKQYEYYRDKLLTFKERVA